MDIDEVKLSFTYMVDGKPHTLTVSGDCEFVMDIKCICGLDPIDSIFEVLVEELKVSLRKDICAHLPEGMYSTWTNCHKCET